MRFPSGYPNLATLEDAKRYQGSWGVCMSGDVITGGNFTVCRQGNTAELQLNVTQKWQPKTFSLLLYLIPVLRRWPMRYQWRATVNLEDLSLREEWIRK
jgi:hypothetical protein